MKIIYYGPTMGKTTAAKKSINLIDFDDVVRAEMEEAANFFGISVQQFKKSGCNKYLEIIKYALDLLKDEFPNHILMVSCAGALKFPEYFEGMYIPSRDEFVKRNIYRGGNKEDSESWYDDIMNKWGGKDLLTIEDRFISDIYNISLK